MFRCMLTILLLSVTAYASAGEIKFRTEEIDNKLGVGYAVALVDVNGDKKLDIVVVDTTRVVWYENPSWQRRTIIEDQTKKDNVCIAPYDIDGDGQIDFALGADWRPFDTSTGGTIQWLRRGKTLDEKWTVIPIGTEPTVHRIRWADFDGDGRAELIVSPLMGRGTTKPEYAERGVRTLRYPIPKEPTTDKWEAEVINDDVHVSHNVWPTADITKNGKMALLIASFEGISLLERSGLHGAKTGDASQSAPGDWKRTLIGAGNQQAKPNRGASEIKSGRFSGGHDYLATIEPWHGFQVVTYTRPKAGETLWQRKLLDDELSWGHGVWCANLDDDADEELIIGIRDNKDAANRFGVRIYDPSVKTPKQQTSGPIEVDWARQIVDPGGVAVEDLAAADLNGDGRVDIVAAGRSTKNVRIYWNEGKPR